MRWSSHCSRNSALKGESLKLFQGCFIYANPTKSTFEFSSADPLPICLDFLKTKDETDQNVFQVVTSELVKFGYIAHNSIASWTFNSGTGCSNAGSMILMLL